MSGDFTPSRRRAVLEPGTLDATRKNIGNISEDEAARMKKVLGGEILSEKSAPIDYSKFPARSRRRSQSAGDDERAEGSASKNPRASRRQRGKENSGEAKTKPSAPRLPPIEKKEERQINRIMMSYRYSIKPNYSIFNFIKYFQKDGWERVIPDFVQITVKSYIDHIEAFAEAVENIIQTVPDFYRAKIQQEYDLPFRILRKVTAWSLKEMKLAHINLGQQREIILVEELIPLVKEIYKPIITLHYLKEGVVNRAFKELYSDAGRYPGVDKRLVGGYARKAAGEWSYISNRVIRGLYPLLMRMCGSPCSDYSFFFAAEASLILGFLDLRKTDLVMPEVPQPVPQPAPEETQAEQTEEAASPEEEEADEKKEEELSKHELVEQGLALLETLFPGAGFDNIEAFPDMWPYFDPLYDFDDCFVMLSPENPLQITIILCSILQDFFHACSGMKFKIDENPVLISREGNISQAFDEWPYYVDTLFEKEYGDFLKRLVNQTYVQSEYPATDPGKKNINELLWQTKYMFLPYFEFDQITLDRPTKNLKYTPLFIRAAFLNDVFTYFLKEIVAAEAEGKSEITGLENPWEHYNFAIESPVSKRINVLLNGKNRGENMKATNANLLKYTACIMAVLNWWINIKYSPAYKADWKKIYRTMPETNEPSFSVEPRVDQDRLFVENIRAAIKKSHEAPTSKAPASEQAATQAE